MTIEGSRFHDTILDENGTVSSHIARDFPGGEKEYLERSECDKLTLDAILQKSVKAEVELPDSEWVFIWDRMVIFKLALGLLLMTKERRSGSIEILEKGGVIEAQKMLIRLTSGEAFGFRIMSKVKLKYARRSGYDACVINYQGNMHLATIKERTVVIAEMMDQESFDGLAGIVKYRELMRYLVLDEGEALGVDEKTVRDFRKRLLGDEPEN